MSQDVSHKPSIQYVVRKDARVQNQTAAMCKLKTARSDFRQSLYESFILGNQMHSHQLVIAVNQRSRHPPGHMTDLTLLNFLPYLMKDSLCVCFRTADGSLRSVKSSMPQSVRRQVLFHSIHLENGMKDVQR